jgi:tripartite-type tricarboxylate transporter receptor subunit TctC
LCAAVVLAANLGFSLHARAENFPVRPVRIVVPSAPGGGIDVTARIVAVKLAELWGGGQNAYVENRPGAAMAIGTALVARAPNDGYTLLVAHNGAMSINPIAVPNLSYAPERDFVPVSIIASIPQVILVNPAVPAKSLEEFIQLARSKPGALNHASGGLGSLLPSELLKSVAHIDYVEVPYGGAAQAVNATVAGDTQLLITDVAGVRSVIEGGRLRPLAVTSSKRSALYPKLPTVSESNLPGYDTSVWIGLFAPAGTPEPVVEKVRADVQKVLSLPETRTRLSSLGMEVQSGRGDDLAKAMSEETKKWRSLVKERNLRLQ